MNIIDYLNRINSESQEIFTKTIKEVEAFGSSHHMSACIYEFSSILVDRHERNMLTTVSTQIEASSINLALGFYRQAFAALRLALEMGLGAVYFSIDKIAHYEWLRGEGDIKWHKLIDSESGILSKRFAKAFFPELEPYIKDYNENASIIYRRLSEYVHGNNETWEDDGIKIKYNIELVEEYFKFSKQVSETILFSMYCRYLKDLTAEHLDSVPQELNHISPIRTYFGGPK